MVGRRKRKLERRPRPFLQKQETEFAVIHQKEKVLIKKETRKGSNLEEGLLWSWESSSLLEKRQAEK